MQVGFAGTPAFAAHVLEALLAAGFSVPVVLTQPDRPRGRGLKVAASPVKQLAIERLLPVMQLQSLRDVDVGTLGLAPDVLVVSAYGLLLPPAILAWPRLGCVNVHASLLPRWRGAAPIQRALLAGDIETGVTIMQMDAGLDTGPMLHVVRVAIASRETTGTLHDKLAETGSRAIVTVLAQLARGGSVVATPQPAEGVTYAAKMEHADTVIDWRRSAQDIDCQVRALNPAPGAVTAFAGDAVKVWRAEPLVKRHEKDAGTVLAADASGLVVACGDGALLISQVQGAGRKPMEAAAFAAGRRVAVGDRFGGAPPRD